MIGWGEKYFLIFAALNFYFGNFYMLLFENALIKKTEKIEKIENDAFHPNSKYGGPVPPCTLPDSGSPA